MPVSTNISASMPDRIIVLHYTHFQELMMTLLIETPAQPFGLLAACCSFSGSRITTISNCAF